MAQYDNSASQFDSATFDGGLNMVATYAPPAQLVSPTLNRNWAVQINTATGASAFTTPTWVTIRGRTDWTPGIAPNMTDSSDFDGGGYLGSTKVTEQWTLAFKVIRKVIDAAGTAYDAGQEALRAAGPGVFGVGNVVDVRWFETAAPFIEAYRGYASVEWSPDGGDNAALTTVSVTLTGQGARTAIANPASPS